MTPGHDGPIIRSMTTIATLPDEIRDLPSAGYRLERKPFVEHLEPRTLLVFLRHFG